MKLQLKLDSVLGSLSGVKRNSVPAPPPVPMAPYDPRTVLLQFGRGQHWTLKDAYEGVQIFGGTGSGKTSGSGAALALSFLRQGFGGLVLSAKPDDRALWESYCAATGRTLTVFGPGSSKYFNFLEYEFARPGVGAGLTSNVAELFAALTDKKPGQGGSNESYFENAMKQMLRRAIDVVTCARGTLSLPMIMDAIMSAPQTQAEAKGAEWKKSSFLAKCLAEAEEEASKGKAPDFDHTRRFWLKEFPALGDRTRSSIVSMFTVLADGFLTGPMRDLFCTRLNIVPEETHAGKIIFVDLPVEVYKEVGVAAQMLWKHCWQEATARRQPDKDGGIPTFLWADESQFFCGPGDIRFQATARSKRACTVYLTQNLPSYFYQAGQDRTNALLGNLQTKIFHSNGDHVTNTYAADSIARGVMRRSSMSTGNGGTSIGSTESVDYIVPPAEFLRLRKGGPENGNLVDAYIFQAGRVWAGTGDSFLKTTFRQPNLQSVKP